MKTLFALLFLLAALLYGCNTSYLGSYSVTSIYKLDGTMPTQIDWLQLDTLNIYSNNCIISLEKFSITSNGKYAYIESEPYKSNINSEENDIQLEKIIIDYKKNEIYFLNEKKKYNLVSNDKFERLIKIDSNRQETFITNKNSKSKIQFSKLVPTELKAKLVTRKNKWGVFSIENSQQKIYLNSFEKCTKCVNFKDLIKEADSVCVKENININLIFPN